MRLSNLILDVQPGDTLWIDEHIEIKITRKPGSRMRMRLIIPRHVAVQLEKKVSIRGKKL